MRPRLDVYLTSGCPSFVRTRAGRTGCEALHALVNGVEHDLDTAFGMTPAGVVGGPTVVFMGDVISPGTPDCLELVARVRANLTEVGS